MGATFSRLKNWTEEILSNTDLNAEIDNILNNLTPSGADDYSTNAAQMRLDTDPGEVGSESLATSLAGELERLRFAIREIKGGDVDYWYETADTSLSVLRSLLGENALTNYIASGTESSRSSLLIGLTPNGATTSVTLQGAPTNFIVYINSSQYVMTADITITGLSAAPSSGNTCLVDDGNAAGGDYTGYLGEHGSVINVDTMGTAITSFVGKTAGFKVVSGGSTEYFLGYVNSTTQITKARRGYFHDSSGNPMNRITFSNNNTISLCRPSWVFLNTSASMVVTYNQPVYSPIQPSSAVTGDYWYDMVNRTWKTYNSVTWLTASSTLIGMTLQDTAACVAARTFDPAAALSELNTVDLEMINSAVVQVKNYGAKLSVFNSLNNYEMYRPSWDMAADLDSGVTEAANTEYYFYIKENGAPVISNLAPHDRRGDLLGFYHPSELWRCVGHALNNGSSNLTAPSVVAFSRAREESFHSNDGGAVGDMKFLMSSTPEAGWLACEGASLSRYKFYDLFAGGIQAISTACGTADAYSFNAPKTQGYTLRGWNHGAGIDPDIGTASRTAMSTGGATGDNLGSVQADAFQGHSHLIRDSVGFGANNVIGKSAGGGETAQITHVDAGIGTNAARYHAAEAEDGGNGTPRTSAETRMKNFNVLFAIKVAR